MRYTRVIYILSLYGIFFSSLLLPDVACASEGHLDWTNFTYRIINLVIFVGLLYFIASKRIRTFFGERKARIYSEFEVSAKEKQEAQKALEEVKKKIKQLESECSVILLQAQEEALALKKAMLEEAEREVEKITSYAQKRMATEQEKMKQKLIVEIAERIYQDVESKLQGTLTSSMQKEILHSSIQKVVTFEKEISSKTLC